MKNLILKIFILTGFLPCSLTAQPWQKLPFPNNATLNEFCAKDSRQIVVVGTNGLLMQSTDGGVNFQNVTSGTTKNLTSVACTNEKCFVLAENKMLVSSDNQTWNTFDLPEFGSKIYFFEKRIGFVTGCKKGQLMKSIDGGSTWEVIESNYPTYFIKAISMYSDLEGCAIAQDVNYFTRKPTGKILKTLDGGYTWNEVSSQVDHSYNALQMLNANKGFAVGIYGQVMASNDGGNTWTQINLSINDNIKSVYFTDDLIGYMVGTSGKVLKTTNAGFSWQNLNTGVNDLFKSCYFTDLNKGFILAGRQLLKTSTGGL